MCERETGVLGGAPSGMLGWVEKYVREEEGCVRGGARSFLVLGMGFLKHRGVC